ncbi:MULTISPECIES: hypothetical protein [Trichocoleus]|uniref:HTH cro/C1-type domain-containing protein n=1 Tax=Trichocoleus desertorum GB2-A4 TaxID=2933944 RepID=A0ABV0JCR3_9CYAN|nr:hypothetical protein [Trichocoleus sp. FACHB-46]MBD1864201.1 hypothetical protein [Trichocoleus sp. FACHB-46]
MHYVQISYQHLREGNISLLAELTGFNSVQLSMWFNTSRQPNRQSIQRLSRTTGVPEADVMRAIDDRRADVAAAKEINEAIRRAIAERQLAKAKHATVHI